MSSSIQSSSSTQSSFDPELLKAIKEVDESNVKAFEVWIKTLTRAQKALWDDYSVAKISTQKSRLAKEGFDNLFEWIEALGPPVEEKKKEEVRRGEEMSTPKKTTRRYVFESPVVAPFGEFSSHGEGEPQLSDQPKARPEVDKIIMRSIHNYKELERSDDAVAWLSNLVSVITSVSNLRESDKIRILAAKLHPAARGMLEAMEPQPATLENAVNRLIPRLSDKSASAIQNSLDLKFIKQNENEPSFAFYHRFSELLFRTYGRMDDSKVLELMKDRLNVRTMNKLTLYKHSITTLDDALNIFKIIDSEFSFPPVQYAQVSVVQKKGVQCPFCGKMGHTLEDCWNAPGAYSGRGRGGARGRGSFRGRGRGAPTGRGGAKFQKIYHTPTEPKYVGFPRGRGGRGAYRGAYRGSRGRGAGGKRGRGGFGRGGQTHQGLAGSKQSLVVSSSSSSSSSSEHPAQVLTKSQKRKIRREKKNTLTLAEIDRAAAAVDGNAVGAASSE